MEWAKNKNIDAVEVESVANLKKIHHFLKDKDTSGMYVFEEVLFKKTEYGYFLSYNSLPCRLEVEFTFDRFLVYLRSLKDDIIIDL